jgi:hypothetical protein
MPIRDCQVWPNSCRQLAQAFRCRSEIFQRIRVACSGIDPTVEISYTTLRPIHPRRELVLVNQPFGEAVGGLGSAAAVLELLGFLVPATQVIGIVAATAEIVLAIIIELRGRYVDRPLREGSVGWLTRAGAFLAGPISLLLRFFGGHSPGLRYLAALCFVAGALITRYAWIAAGRVSSRDPQALFQIQRRDPQANS